MADRDPKPTPDVICHVGVWTWRLSSVMNKHAFNGAKAVACLRSLAPFPRKLDGECIPEGAALRIWPKVLEGEAYKVFTQMHENGAAELGGFSDWPDAVQFFLKTYVNMSTSRTKSSGQMVFARAAVKTSWPFTAGYSLQHATSQRSSYRTSS